MKYLLTALKQKNNTLLLLENIIPAQTGHIKGYGSGVTFTGKGPKWFHHATFAGPHLLHFSDPIVITQ
ncbi:MAG TPA: hypothetical protein VEB86_12720 [Chryseosolibacter sp.]|nr:hypothetical protein [Chryseosolibacter sp.]